MRGAAKCTYGTGSFLLVHTGSTPKPSNNGLLTTVALKHPDGRLDYALEGAIFVTGSAVQWLRDGLQIIDSAPEVEELARSVPDSAGVVLRARSHRASAHPIGIHGRAGSSRESPEGPPEPTSRGPPSRRSLTRSRDVVDLMSEEGGVELERLAIDGGAAANDLLCQMQADQLRIPVDRSAELQTTGVGAAFLAGLGVGVWKDIAELQHTRTSSRSFRTPRRQ